MNATHGMDSISRDRDYPCISNSIDISSSIQKDPVPENKRITTHEVEDPRNFIIPIYKKHKIRIYKPLILLKLALFVWYGAGPPMGTFLKAFLKQKGMTSTELSIVFIITPFAQFISIMICGIIADKFGKSKSVLAVNLLLNIVIVISMLVSPEVVNCDPLPVSLKCHREEFGRLIAKTSCDVNTTATELASCNVTCPENVTQYCRGQNLICDMLAGNEDFSLDNFSLSVHVSWAYKLKSKCYYNVTSMSHRNVTYSWCNIPHKMYCKISCLMEADEGCSANNSTKNKILLILYIVLLILFHSVFWNTYRLFDVTAMTLVKEHNSDFGRERFFGIAGILVFSPFAGYLIGKTKSDEGDMNYATILYFFIIMVFILFFVLYKLQVPIKPPGRNMWRKSFFLLKSVDIVSFVAILLVLGTASGFTRKYISKYLEIMNAPSFLLGLILAASALYGLPFLFWSNWWVKQIGTTQIFILGLLGYVASGIGYSFLYDPWISLLIEVTGIFTYHLLWVAVVVHSYSLAPEGLTATVIAVAGGFHFSIGEGTGRLFGSLATDVYGVQVAYRIMAVFCLVAAVLYAIYLFIRRACYTASLPMNLESDDENKEENELQMYKEDDSF